MEKQHNRGQDGAGVANIKLDVKPGVPYLKRYRSSASNAIQEIFKKVNGNFAEVAKNHPNKFTNAEWLKNHVAFSGELLLGHLRYGTYGGNTNKNCHPFIRENNWQTRNLVVAGNFNLTNVDELFDALVELGQHPTEKNDTITVLEKIGHFLDEENEILFKKFKAEGHTNDEISKLIAENLNVETILKRASKYWDGGYVMAGLFGHGDSFVMRDPNGIRPVFYYADEEVIVVASERPAIQTVLNVPIETIREITPGHALVIRKDGDFAEKEIIPSGKKLSCTFERIYFSRGNDRDIYQERQKLGEQLCPAILQSINHDLRNTVFSYIPNTAEVAFLGLVDGMQRHMNERKKKVLKEFGPNASEEQIAEILNQKLRIEKIAIKDAKLRTFITQDTQRDDLVAHVYDVTYGVVKEVDNLVVIDDSIVRGTTLKQSIIRILDRLNPKKIVIVSSAPQIRYPDCYGIDMAKMGDFVAFQAAIALLKESFKENYIEEIYEKAKAQESLPKSEIMNVVKGIYAPFTDEQISAKISQLLRPEGMKAELEIIYQSIEGLHKACPNHKGDWYFSGNYPTPGGNKVVNRSFMNYVEGKNVRAY